MRKWIISVVIIGALGFGPVVGPVSHGWCRAGHSAQHHRCPPGHFRA